MKKLTPLTLFIVAALAVVGAAYLKGLPLLPTRQSTITLLYTADVEGYIQPAND